VSLRCVYDNVARHSHARSADTSWPRGRCTFKGKRERLASRFCPCSSLRFSFNELKQKQKNFSSLSYPINSRFLLLRMMLDVVTIDGRVSGHLLVRPRGVPRRELPSQPPILCHPFRARQPFRGSRNRPQSRVVPRSRLSRDYSRLSTTGSVWARAALTLAFSTRLLSHSFSPKTSLEARSLSSPRKRWDTLLTSEKRHLH